MPSFSQRNGYVPLPPAMEPESITDELRSSLWNLIDSQRYDDHYSEITRLLWCYLYRLPADTRPAKVYPSCVDYRDSWGVVREKILNGKWFDVYDHVEFFVDCFSYLAPKVNRILQQEAAAYRIIDGKVCQITDEIEIAEIQTGIEHGDKFAPVSEHIRAAVQLMSDRSNPSYRNSIKESISAVESALKIVTDDFNGDFSKMLASLEKSKKIDGALKKGFAAIYGWTSDQNGIRHGMLDKPNLNHEDAKLFLVMCSAFANYLKTV